MKGQEIDNFRFNDNRVLWVTKENHVRNSPDSSFLQRGDFPTGEKPRQREENSTYQYGDVRDTMEKVNARMQKARCPQQLETCRPEATQPPSEARSIERSEFCCEDNGRNTPGNARKGVIQLMDLQRHRQLFLEFWRKRE